MVVHGSFQSQNFDFQAASRQLARRSEATPCSTCLVGAALALTQATEHSKGPWLPEVLNNITFTPPCTHTHSLSLALTSGDWRDGGSTPVTDAHAAHCQLRPRQQLQTVRFLQTSSACQKQAAFAEGGSSAEGAPRTASPPACMRVVRPCRQEREMHVKLKAGLYT